MIWKSYHIKPSEVEDVFLVRVIKPFLQNVVWIEPSAKAFFVRFIDETGPHLRLRIKGRSTWLNETAIPELKAYCDRKCTLEEQPYIPEADRFGGEGTMVYVEEHFHLSSRMALQRISKIPYIYSDAMYDAVRMHCMTCYAAGYDLEKSVQFMKQLRDSWLPHFIQDENGEPLTQEGKAELIATFDTHLEPQREKLKESLSDVWYYLKQGLFDAKQPEWEGWYRGNKMIFRHLGDKTDIALPQLIHMHNNRMGIANYDEVYLNHMLSEVLA
jgi:thiopeptide-type bacteriocin biosynthesis protein